MEIETQDRDEVTATDRLLVSNLDYEEVGLAQLVEAFAKYGQIKEAFLSKPIAAGKKNAGWAMLVTDKETARKILAATIVIANRVVRVKPAKPKDD